MNKWLMGAVLVGLAGCENRTDYVKAVVFRAADQNCAPHGGLDRAAQTDHFAHAVSYQVWALCKDGSFVISELEDARQ